MSNKILQPVSYYALGECAEFREIEVYTESYSEKPLAKLPYAV